MSGATLSDRVMVPTRLLRTEWPPTPQLMPGGSERFDAVFVALHDEPMHTPIQVRLDWQVIDGCHRLQAARLLGIEIVPVVFWTGHEWLPAAPDTTTGTTDE